MKRRIIKPGETFTEADLAEADLETVAPVGNPDDFAQDENWAVDHGDA